jgi:hypothetical protein
LIVDRGYDCYQVPLTTIRVDGPVSRFAATAKPLSRGSGGAREGVKLPDKFAPLLITTGTAPEKRR